MSEQAAAWHVALAVAGALLLAIVLVALMSSFELPLVVVYMPLVVAVIYGCSIIGVRFHRAWQEFPDMRLAMLRRRRAELLYGGYALKRFERLTWLRVTLPFWIVVGGGGIVAAVLFPRRRDIRGIAFCIVIGVAGMWMSHWLRKWNERTRPRDLDRLCPRCGYDLSASPQRCPECGMRRMKPGEVDTDADIDGW